MPALTRLRLIQFRAAYNMPVLAAKEFGIFAKHGLAVEVSYAPSSDFLIAALAGGRVEIAHTAADDVLAARARARGLRDPRSALFLFMGLHSGLLSVVAGPGYHDAESLKGRTLGVDSKRTGFVFLLKKFLRSKGLDAEDNSLSEIGGWDQRYRALLEKQIAATLLTPPYIEDALEAGCTVLAKGNQIVPVYQATCGAARRPWAREHADTLVRYIRAYVEATQWCFDPVNRRACLDLLGWCKGLGQRRGENTLAALLDPQYGLYPLAEINLAGLAAVLALREDCGDFSLSKASVEDAIDLSYHDKALSGRARPKD